MQFIDIAVGSGYAAVCISLIVLINPVAERQAAVEAGAQSRLDSAISAYVTGVGLQFLDTAPAVPICESAAVSSNSTFVIEISIPGQTCSGSHSPGSPLAQSSISLELPLRTVVIVAFYARD